jgi:hypothetical protein
VDEKLTELVSKCEELYDISNKKYTEGLKSKCTDFPMDELEM